MSVLVPVPGGGCVPCDGAHKTAEVYDTRSLPCRTGAQNNEGMRAISSRRRARNRQGSVVTAL
jgi:hypothetical protein